MSCAASPHRRLRALQLFLWVVAAPRRNCRRCSHLNRALNSVPLHIGTAERRTGLQSPSMCPCMIFRVCDHPSCHICGCLWGHGIFRTTRLSGLLGHIPCLCSIARVVTTAGTSEKAGSCVLAASDWASLLKGLSTCRTFPCAVAFSRRGADPIIGTAASIVNLRCELTRQARSRSRSTLLQRGPNAIRPAGSTAAESILWVQRIDNFLRCRLGVSEIRHTHQIRTSE
jgi:hypothetical protein